MKGIILGGGKGTRLDPMTKATNKHLLPIWNTIMIEYPIRTLVNAGITDVKVVTGGPHAGDYLSILGNGKEYGIRHLEYAYQEGEGGIAQALSLCEDFADDQNIMVILGDNTTDANVSRAVATFDSGACIFLKEVPDPERFGVAVFDPTDDSRIIRIDEKPKEPETDLAVTGLYIYDSAVWDYIRRTKPSGRGELEITDVNNFYIEAGTMRWQMLNGFWSDAGMPETLLRSSMYWAHKDGIDLRAMLEEIGI